MAILGNQTTQAQFHIEITNRYQALQDLTSTESVEDKWQNIKEALTSACKATVGRKSTKRQDWITPDTLQKVNIHRKKKEALNNSKTRAAKHNATQEYSKANREVRISARRDKRK